MPRFHALLLLLLSVLSLLALTHGQASFAEDIFADEDEVPILGYDTAGNPIKPEVKREINTQVHTTNPDLGKRAQKVDLPFIACDVCTLVMTELHNQTAVLATKAENLVNGKPKKSVMLKLTKRVCDHATFEGRWISYYDIQEKERVGGIALKLVKQPESGMCEVEAETIAKSCSDLFKKDHVERDEVVDDLVEQVISKSGLVTKYCKDISSRCSKNTQSLMEKGKRRDHKFHVKTKEAKSYDRIMDAFAEAGVLGNDDGTAAPDIMDRFDNVLKMLEENGEL
ncbi:Hypothetical protein NocV09_03900410 [Nannochloropsis oceanica]